MPESFNVLVRELKGLGLNVELLSGEGKVLDTDTKSEIPDENASRRQRNQD